MEKINVKSTNLSNVKMSELRSFDNFFIIVNQMAREKNRSVDLNSVGFCKLFV